MAFKFKTAKGSSTLTETPFNVGRIQNERIMPKKEAYAFLVEEVGGKKADHAPDGTKADEFVALLSDMGTVICKATINYSDLQNVKGVFEDAEVEPGEYTIAVFTRSGMGEEYGVKSATRKVTVK